MDGLGIDSADVGFRVEPSGLNLQLVAKIFCCAADEAATGVPVSPENTQTSDQTNSARPASGDLGQWCCHRHNQHHPRSRRIHHQD